ncbi:putative leucine Rich Repeat family protein [Paratrimastix pyriformis]|uniref:Leucine Rich Repeat family protein n=1 Tax=Paratrimastix pyriformis TaxID=342808 RepID=A0ABQ8US86_9EUKA|nr:putative leucine Rich Repeat family protein [Paratrimastix pyriformis]
MEVEAPSVTITNTIFSIQGEFFNKLFLDCYLPHAAEHCIVSAVCKEWRQKLSQRTHLDFSPRTGESRPPHQISDDCLDEITKHLPALRSINLTKCVLISSRGLAALANNSSSTLRSLQLFQCHQLGDDAASHIARLIRLEFLGITRTRFSAPAVATMIEPMPDLANLQLHGVETTDGLLDRVVASCPTLKTINLTYARGLTSPGTIGLVTRLPQLQDVDLSYCDPSTAVFEALARCPNLTRLAAHAASHLTDACVMPLVAGCPHLETLELVGAPLTEPALIQLVGGLRALRWADLRLVEAVSDGVIARLVAANPALEHVALRGCHQLTDAALRSLAGLSQLAHLDTAMCLNLTDEGMLGLLRARRGSLRELIVPLCAKLTGAVLEEAANMPHMTNIEWVANQAVPPEALERMSREHPGLRLRI